MHVTVKLFAGLREVAGAELQCELPDGATLRDAWAALVARHPQLSRWTGVISGAVDAEYAALGTRLHDGAEVAFLPPVSGG